MFSNHGSRSNSSSQTMALVDPRRQCSPPPSPLQAHCWLSGRRSGHPLLGLNRTQFSSGGVPLANPAIIYRNCTRAIARASHGGRGTPAPILEALISTKLWWEQRWETHRYNHWSTAWPGGTVRREPVTESRHLKEGVRCQHFGTSTKQRNKKTIYKSSNRLTRLAKFIWTRPAKYMGIWTRLAKSLARLPDFVHLTCHMLDQIRQSRYVSHISDSIAFSDVMADVTALVLVLLDRGRRDAHFGI